MSFKNELLEKLFKGVLQNQDIAIRRDLLPTGTIEEAMDLVPLQLSENQRTAITNAWRSEISYVQGPPGTGKSHTITALMLTGVLLGKRVLMVSHKRPAVEIVQSKLTDFLGEGSVIYLGPKPEQRQAMRGALQQLCADADTLRASARQRRNREAKDQLKRKVGTLFSAVKTMKAQIVEALEGERIYYVANEHFLRTRNDFIEVFDVADAHKIKLADRLQAPDRYRRYLAHADVLLQERRPAAGGQLARKDWMFVRRLFSEAIRAVNADAGKLEPNPNATLYLKNHLELTLAHQDSNSARSRITADFLVQHRRALEKKTEQLETAKRELLQAEFACHLGEHVSEFLTEVEKFEKLIYRRNPRRILELMGAMDFPALTTTFPLWVGEMRHLGEFLPFQTELFDLVVVDEASQVNIAEIIPAFYRGTRFCVVGDKKQLGLSAAGLFALNRTFEQLIWNQHFSDQHITHVQADERALLVSKSSILDFITCPNNRFSIPKATLNEHFRSLPQLASFTSERFYREDGGLKLMREVAKNVRKQCFCGIEVQGLRNPDTKIVPEEVQKLLEQLRYLINQQGYLEDPRLRTHDFSAESPPSIGVISFLTNQRNHIKSLVEDAFLEEDITKHKLMVGTPEDFQGNERNIIFITLGLDGSSRWAKGHYEDHQRFNVATSRAIDFTYVIYGGIPQSADLIKKYLRHFGANWTTITPLDSEEPLANPTQSRYAWRYHPGKRESEFEIRVDEYLQEFISKHGQGGHIELFNQVESCGQKRLDFVLFNQKNGECCAVEVDGREHFGADGRSYSEAHSGRVDTLRRAGWKIVHVPYYHWYRDGWICEKGNLQFQNTLESLYSDLRSSLKIRS